jgi:hypothetical protein
MSGLLRDHESWLEAGLVLLGLGVLGGLAALVAGRLSGDSRRGARHAERSPSPGAVSDERHQNIAGPSPR